MSDLSRGTEDAHSALSPWVEAARRTAVPGVQRLETDLGPVFLKFGPLRGSASRRYGLRARFGLPTPRLHEFDNLAWLRAAGFGAPEPLAAGIRIEGARATFQFLATRELPGRRTLRAFLTDPPGIPRARREAVLAEVGERVALLHAAGFVHRDLFPRNLLVDPGGAHALAFLDTWRGGPRRQPPGRGVAFDLACLLLYLPTLADEKEEELLLASYRRAAGLANAGAEARWARLERRARRARAHLLDALRKRGRRTPELPAR